MGGGMMQCAPTEGVCFSRPVALAFRPPAAARAAPVQSSKFNLSGAKSRKAGVQKDGADCQPS